jgi:Zn-finger nucleic acid-binding protein
MGTGKPRSSAAPRPRRTASPAGRGAEPKAAQDELAGSRLELERTAERLHARECALTELRGLLERLEKSLESANAERDEADRRAHAHAEKVTVVERELVRRTEAEDQRGRQLDELRERLEGRAAELEAARAEAAAAAEKAASLREQLGLLRDEQARQLQLEEQELAAVRAELDQARGRVAELEHQLAAEREARSQLLSCPRCTGPMVQLDHMGVTLDRCTRCDGLYFDAGELEEVIRNEYAAAAPGPVQVDDLDDDADTLVDAPPVRRSFFTSLFARRRPGETPPTDGESGAR